MRRRAALGLEQVQNSGNCRGRFCCRASSTVEPLLFIVILANPGHPPFGRIKPVVRRVNKEGAPGRGRGGGRSRGELSPRGLRLRRIRNFIFGRLILSASSFFPLDLARARNSVSGGMLRKARDASLTFT